MLIVEKIKWFCPRWAWIKTVVFLHSVAPGRTDRRFLYACYGKPWLPTVVQGGTIGADYLSQLEVPDQVNAMSEAFLRHHV
jgi:hypothetical protein